jgi:hypothetical protein
VDEHSEICVGLDVAKARHAVAVADGERQGEVRYLGEIDADPVSVRRMVARLEKRHRMLHQQAREEHLGRGAGDFRQANGRDSSCGRLDEFAAMQHVFSPSIPEFAGDDR